MRAPPLSHYPDDVPIAQTLFPVGDTYSGRLDRHPLTTNYPRTECVPGWMVALFEYGDAVGTGADFREELDGVPFHVVEEAYLRRCCRYIAYWYAKHDMYCVTKHLGDCDPASVLFRAFHAEPEHRDYAERIEETTRITYPCGRRAPSKRTQELEFTYRCTQALGLDGTGTWPDLLSALLVQRILRLGMNAAMRRVLADHRCRVEARLRCRSTYKQIPFLLDVCAITSCVGTAEGWTKRRANYALQWAHIFDALRSGDVGDGPRDDGLSAALKGV